MRIGITAMNTPTSAIQKATHAQDFPGRGRLSAVTATK
jgi:hypothetical protein